LAGNAPVLRVRRGTALGLGLRGGKNIHVKNNKEKKKSAGGEGQMLQKSHLQQGKRRDVR